MIIEYEIDCWKCPKMHYGVASSEKQFWAIVNGGGDWQHTFRVLSTEPRRIRVGQRGRLWLIPWTRNRGIFICFGDYRPIEIMPWQTARWEFADYGGGTDDWNHLVLTGGRQ